jgi:hypothetical protein
VRVARVVPHSFRNLADAAIDLYAMSAVISKLQAMLPHDTQTGNGTGHVHADVERDLTVGRSFCHHAAQRVRRNLRALFTSKADDQHILRTADAILR